MKVLSIREPWASLIVNGYKNYEFRSWRTKYRGKFLIHASKTVETKNLSRFADYHLIYQPDFIIGEARIVDCIMIDQKKHQQLLFYQGGEDDQN